VVFVRSDQYSFIRQGVPAIFPKAAISPGAKLPSDAITPDVFTKQFYHQPGDDLKLPRDSDSAVRFVRFVTDIARQVADAEEAPRWNPGDFFGTTFGGKGNR
jgi:Zn-dependent M28 family amino/carboxypeptidase